MLDDGVITSAEFEKMKQALLQDIESLPQRSASTAGKKNHWLIPVIIGGVIIIGGGGGYLQPRICWINNPIVR